VPRSGGRRRFAKLGRRVLGPVQPRSVDRDLAERFWPDRSTARTRSGRCGTRARSSRTARTRRSRSSTRSPGSARACRTIDDARVAPGAVPDRRAGARRDDREPRVALRRRAPRGKLLPGYLADLVVLSRDPLDCPSTSSRRSRSSRRWSAAAGSTTRRPGTDASSASRADEGRRLFGGDAEAYDRARPGTRMPCTRSLPSALGSSQGRRCSRSAPAPARRRDACSRRGADPLVALEPDPALAAFLRNASIGASRSVRHTLEDAELEEDFDLAAAASVVSLDRRAAGLERIHGALRPGGSVALWWTLFGLESRPTRSSRRCRSAHERAAVSPPTPSREGRPTRRTRRARIAALERPGSSRCRASPRMDAHVGRRGHRGLFGPSRRSWRSTRGARGTSRRVANIAETQFGGRGDETLVTALYTARRPS
jgi:hypothetical protein